MLKITIGFYYFSSINMLYLVRRNKKWKSTSHHHPIINIHGEAHHKWLLLLWRRQHQRHLSTRTPILPPSFQKLQPSFLPLYWVCIVVDLGSYIYWILNWALINYFLWYVALLFSFMLDCLLKARKTQCIGRR